MVDSSQESTSTEANDWYYANFHQLLFLLACGPAAFLLVALVLHNFMRQKFSSSRRGSKETSDTPELALIKLHTRGIRFLSVCGIVLQIHLLVYLTNLPSTNAAATSFKFSLLRPVSNVCVYFLGFMTNTHAAFRVLYLFMLSEVIVIDTIAEVSIALAISCIHREGLQCGDNAIRSLNLDALKAMKIRDLSCLFLNPWLMLEAAYLGITIGFCSSRYSTRSLSLSRPTFNVRAALASYFPERFGPNAFRNVRPAHVKE